MHASLFFIQSIREEACSLLRRRPGGGALWQSIAGTPKSKLFFPLSTRTPVILHTIPQNAGKGD